MQTGSLHGVCMASTCNPRYLTHQAFIGVAMFMPGSMTGIIQNNKDFWATKKRMVHMVYIAFLEEIPINVTEVLVQVTLRCAWCVRCIQGGETCSGTLALS